MVVGVGDRAPGFVLAGTGGRELSLAELAGQPVVLVFYPGDDTPVCTRQLRHYTEEISQFEGLGAQVVAIGPGEVSSKEAFASAHGFAFPLLADTDKAVARAYGVLGPAGFYRRSVFVVDPGGVIRYAHRATAGLSFKRSDELVAAIRAATA
jgi:peroxiredoxin